MSTLKTNNVQLGQSPTTTNNFVFTTPTVPDGTIKLQRGTKDNPGADVMTVDSGNNVTFANVVASTDFNSTSDVNLKINIGPLDSSILSLLNPVEFNWKDNGQKSYGLIAQEVEEVLPELIHHREDGYLGVSYIPLIAMLIDAVQKLQKEVDELKNQ